MPLGSLSFMNIVKETTTGTFPTGGTRRRVGIASESISQQFGLIPDDTLSAGRSRKGYFAGAQSARGRIMLPMRYENALWALEGVLGGPATSVLASGGETFVWEHLIKEGSVLPSYSVELGEANVPAGKVARILGMKIASATFRIVPGQTEEAYGHIELEVIAQTKNTGPTTGLEGWDPTPSFAVAGCSTTSGSNVVTTSNNFITAGVTPGMTITGTGIPANTYVRRVLSTTTLHLGDADGNNVNASATGGPALTMTFGLTAFQSVPNVPMPPLFYHSATPAPALFPGIMDDGIEIQSDGIRVRSVEIAIANPLTEIYHMGSQNIDDPVPDDVYSARWSIEQEYKNLKLFNAFKLSTPLSPQLRLTHTTDINGALAGQRRFIEFRSNTTKGATFENPVEGPGFVTATQVQEAYQDATDLSAITIFARNMEPTVGPPVIA